MKNKAFTEIIFHKITGTKARVTLLENRYETLPQNHWERRPNHSATIRYKNVDIGIIRVYGNDLFPGYSCNIYLFGIKLISTVFTVSLHDKTAIDSTNKILNKFGVRIE